MSSNPKLGAGYVSSFACFAVAWKAVHEAKVATEALDLPDKFKAPEFAQQARLLREVFGNPFRKRQTRPCVAHYGRGGGTELSGILR